MLKGHVKRTNVTCAKKGAQTLPRKKLPKQMHAHDNFNFVFDITRTPPTSKPTEGNSVTTHPSMIPFPSLRWSQLHRRPARCRRHLHRSNDRHWD